MARRALKHDTVSTDRAAYLLGSRIGIGGMGVVYEAMALGRGERVAIKFLLPERAQDPRARRQFIDEAIAAQVIEHPNVVRVLDGGTTASGEPFVVMELVHGEPLGRRLHREGPLSRARSVDLAQQILAALTCVHGAGIVHADIKSDNVLLAVEGGGYRAKLIDFGLARVQFAADDPSRLPATEEWLSGTPEYMAPEVIRGEGTTFASDLYAVGIILYEMLTGSTPFGGGKPSDVVRRHLEDEVVPPSVRCPSGDLPPALEAIVLRALQKEPCDRFASATEFGAALAAVMETLHPSDEPAVSRRMRRGSSATRQAPTVAGGPRRLRVVSARRARCDRHD